MPKPFTILLGKAVRQAARLKGGSGSALPGLFVEKIDPKFVPDTLSKLPLGVVVISGTNGKTTTTKMVVSLLEGQGLKVFTNKTGSNFVRGVAAALLSDISITGKINADIAVLELDEAHAVKFVDVIKPKYSLLLNVLRDQLDRFGEIDTTRQMLEVVAKNTTDTVVLNSADPRIYSIAKDVKDANVNFFGLNKSLQKLFPSDDLLHAKDTVDAGADDKTKNTVSLESIDGDKATYIINGKNHSTNLKLTGAYNIFNSAAALALAATVLPDADEKKLIKSLSEITPAFGRGEVVDINGTPLEMALVKNPSGFRLALSSYPPGGYATMIAINDNYADGRDMSWLWDVDFDSLKGKDVYTTGIRANDMALRLHYDGISVKDNSTELKQSVERFIRENPNTPKRIYCTYTAMLSIRKILSSYTEVEEI